MLDDLPIGAEIVLAETEETHTIYKALADVSRILEDISPGEAVAVLTRALGHIIIESNPPMDTIVEWVLEGVREAMDDRNNEDLGN